MNSNGMNGADGNTTGTSPSPEAEEAGQGAIADTGSRFPSSYEVDDAHHDRMNEAMNAGGRAVAVNDSVPADVLGPMVSRYGGRLL